MTARFFPLGEMENEVKRRLGPHVQRRGDGFTEAESMGMLQLVRSHWREGWDVIAQLHNQQFSKHNRSADSLKKKFSRLYRSNVPVRGAKNHQAITFAHVVHKEMTEGMPLTRGAVLSSVDDEQSENSFQPPQGDEREQDGGATESEHSWVETPSEVMSSAAAASTSTTSLVTTPVAGSVATASTAAPRPHVRSQSQTLEWQKPAVVFPPEATPLPNDDLLTSVLKVILRSQYQRDLDREEERIRREDERQRRKEEDEQRRQEEEERRNEEREERRRANEERAEEREENRRRHEQFMQMMMLLMGKNDTAEQREPEC